MEVLDSRLSSLAFMTSKHVSHDCCWLVQGVNTALFCFACSMENLEDLQILNIRKKYILMEMLEVLVNSDQIWKVLLDKQSIWSHSLNLMIKLLANATEEEFSKLLVECVMLLVIRTNPHVSSRIVLDAIWHSMDFLKSFGLVSLLAKLSAMVGSSTEILLSLEPPIVEMIICELTVCQSKFTYLLWELLMSVLSDQAHCSLLQPKVSKVLLDMVYDTYHSSPLNTVKLLLLSLLSNFMKVPVLRKVVLTNESSELTPKSRCAVEVLKKSLLSTSEEIQIAAINVIIAMSDVCHHTERQEVSKLMTLSFSGILVEKGICEFLLELLSSKSEALLIVLFPCLQNLVVCEEFFSKGHSIYGAAPVLEALGETMKQVEVTRSGLGLLNTLFDESSRRSLSLLGSDASVIKLVVILQGCLKGFGLKIASLVTTCLSNCLQQIAPLKVSCFDVIGEFLEELAAYFDSISVPYPKQDEDTRMAVCHCCLAIQRFAFILSTKADAQRNAITSAGENACHFSSSSTCSMINLTFYMVDRYMIPLAVRVWLKVNSTDFGRRFYQMLLAVLELDRSKGELLSRKLAESSFLKLVTDFRVINAHQSKKEVDSVLSKIQYYLCMALEHEVRPNEESDFLMNSFIHFNVALKDWQLFLIENPCSVDHDEFIIQARTCIFALLACSCLVGEPFLPVPTMSNLYLTFAWKIENLMNLSCSGKRYFLFGWVFCYHHFTQSGDTHVRAFQNVADFLTQLSDKADVLYMHSDAFLLWLLSSQLPVEVSVRYSELYFVNILRRKDRCDLHIGALAGLISSNGLVDKAIKLLVQLLSSCQLANVNEACLNVLQVLFNQEHGAAAVRETVRKLFLASCDTMSVENMGYLFRVLNSHLLSTDPVLTTEDMKLFCRALALCFSVPNSPLQLDLLNYVYIVITMAIRMENPSPVSVMLNSDHIFLELEKRIFSNGNLLAYAQGSHLLEQICAEGVLLASQLLVAFHHFNLTSFGRDAVKVVKANVVALVQNPATPLLQVAALRFWTDLFRVRCRSQLVSFVDIHGAVCPITERDLSLVVIGLQNIICSRSQLSLCHAAECFKALHENYKKPDVLVATPWNSILLEYCMEFVEAHGVDSSICKVLHTLLSHLRLVPSHVLHALALLSEKVLPERDLLNLLPILDVITSKLLDSVDDKHASLFGKLAQRIRAQLHNLDESSDAKLRFRSMSNVLIQVAETPVETADLMTRVDGILRILKEKVRDVDCCSDVPRLDVV